MCRKLVLAATVLSLAAGPVLAAEAPTAKPAAAATALKARKATAEEKAIAERADPMARAAFWAHQLDIDPTDQEAGLKMSAALRQLGQFDKAAETAQIVATANPGNEEAWLEVARDIIGAGNGFYAIDPAKKAQALKPKDWRPVSLLGVGLEQAERYDEAEAAYRQALTLSPDNPSVLANLAMMKAGQGDGEQAEALLRKAVAQPGATMQVRQNLSLVLGLRGKMAEAEKLMRQDLPPEMANNNLAYLKGVAASAAPAPGAPPADRSYQSLQRQQDGG
jgi:Flp pilus assembly protein TadD